jgi:hypothetical protein
MANGWRAHWGRLTRLRFGTKKGTSMTPIRSVA